MGKKVKVMIKTLLVENNMSLRKLSLVSGVRHAALSELANQDRQQISVSHIERLAEALDINDMNKIIAIVDTDDDDDKDD
jgi:putative transcriptional regulator